jgi:hemolysin III
MQKYFRDPVSGLTHLAGAFLGCAGLVYLVSQSPPKENPLATLAFAIFGISVILLYSASALYHLLNISEDKRLVLRRIDHSMIFVLIAGTYTPFCLIPLRGTLGFSILAIEWLSVFAGLFLSTFWIHAPRKLTTVLYLVMGWVALFALYPLSQSLTQSGLFWLVAGGLFYTVGAVIYAIKWPDPLPPHFGFHEIWHLFVLAGSISHFLAVASLL